MNKKLLALTMAGVLSVGALTIAPVSAAAADNTSTVTYTNRTTVDPEGAQWQVFIPSGIAFTDKDLGIEKKVEGIELAGANGTAVTEFHDAFTVTGTVVSPNGYRLGKDGAAAIKPNPDDASVVADPSYTLKFGTVVTTVDDDTAIDLPELKKTAKTIDVKATLASTAKVKGTYSDALTFTFTASADNAITNK